MTQLLRSAEILFSRFSSVITEPIIRAVSQLTAEAINLIELGTNRNCLATKQHQTLMVKQRINSEV